MKVQASPDSVGISSLPSTDRKSTRLNSSHSQISYAVFCLKKKSLYELISEALPDKFASLHTLVGTSIHLSSQLPIITSGSDAPKTPCIILNVTLVISQLEL